ncbi:MAG: EcsC family protein [Desulfobacterales bacterium]
MNISQTDQDDLQYAKSLLENPGLAAKIVNTIGVPVEKGFDILPKGWRETVASSSRKALQVALDSAIFTMHKGVKQKAANNTLHKLLVAGSGAAGGFWGLPALPLELPISTTIMLRSIADIARSEEQLLEEPRTKLACIEVFALGGKSRADDAVESGYFAVRSGLAKAVSEASRHLALKGFAEKNSPVLIKLIAQISSRFGIQVSEKLAAQAIPVIGAAGGVVINTLFIDHFQAMARGHFIVLRLENKYGMAAVRQAYDGL